MTDISGKKDLDNGNEKPAFHTFPLVIIVLALVWGLGYSMVTTLAERNECANTGGMMESCLK